MKISRIHKYILDVIDKKKRPYYEKKALRALKRNKKLWEALSAFTEQTTHPPGAAYFDYWMLYQYVRTHKPREILECGMGITTVVLAYAVFENDKEGVEGRVTSMEEHEGYYNDVLACFPNDLKTFVDFVLSKKTEDYFGLFRGVRYAAVPDRTYDFVFIDGPTTAAPSDNQKTFDFDFVRVLQNAEQPVTALVDTRMSACWVLKHILKDGKVKFDYMNQVGIIGPCTKEDIRPGFNALTVGLGPRPLPSGNVLKLLKT